MLGVLIAVTLENLLLRCKLKLPRPSFEKACNALDVCQAAPLGRVALAKRPVFRLMYRTSKGTETTCGVSAWTVAGVLDDGTGRNACLPLSGAPGIQNGEGPSHQVSKVPMKPQLLYIVSAICFSLVPVKCSP